MNTRQDKYGDEKNAGILTDPGALLILFYVAIVATFVVTFLVLGTLVSASAGDDNVKKISMDEVRRGELLIADSSSGDSSSAPLLSQEVHISISGMVAKASVTQHFENTGSDWIEATYVFPLPDESAVTHLRMVIGERVIVGEIKEKNAAREIYEKAKNEGKKTSLLAQKRPNIFTMAVANIPPRAKIEVVIEYLDTVRYVDNTFSLRFPMVVGPRYIPGTPFAADKTRTIAFDAGGWAVDTDEVDDASQITPPVAAPGQPSLNPVALTLTLAPGFPVKGLTSLYHGIDVKEGSDGTYVMKFNGKVFADRDFVIEYQPANGREIAAALFTEPGKAGDYMLLMLMPPTEKLENKLPREVIFVLDISGSMAGESMVQAKRALQYAVARLQSQDRFNIIVFNNNARQLFATSLPADDANKLAAEKIIAAIDADGGTEIAAALELALDGRKDHTRLRQVVFLTDGAVGNESALFSMIAKEIGDSRLFTVGIGSAPNAYFMTRAATMGRGTFVAIGKIEEVERIMTNLFAKLENPVLSTIEVEGDEGSVIEMYPEPLPDLYSGEPIVALIKSEKPLQSLHLRGARWDKTWELAINTGKKRNNPGVASLWARKKIRSLMDSLHTGAAEAEVKPEVLATALEHHLVSRYTSLVAVEQLPARPSGEASLRRQINTNLPQGWQHDKIFATTAKTGTASEQLFIGGMILLLVSLLFLRKRRSL